MRKCKAAIRRRSRRQEIGKLRREAKALAAKVAERDADVALLQGDLDDASRRNRELRDFNAWMIDRGFEFRGFGAKLPPVIERYDPGQLRVDVQYNERSDFREKVITLLRDTATRKGVSFPFDRHTVRHTGLTETGLLRAISDAVSRHVLAGLFEATGDIERAARLRGDIEQWREARR